MKILFVDDDARLGGGQLALRRYLAHPSVHDRELVVLQEGSLANWARLSGIPTTSLGWNRRRRLTSLWRSLIRAQRLLRTGDHDAIVANSLTAAIFLSLLPKPAPIRVLYVREGLTRETLTGPRRAMVARWVLPRFDAFLANSRWTASTIPGRAATRPVCVVYTVSGVDGDGRTTDRPSDVLRVLSLSRLVPSKGVHVLLQALTMLAHLGLADRIRATIAGDDGGEDDREYVARLKEMAASLGDMVTFTGHVDDVRPLLAAHHVLANCTVDTEAFGQVIVQGMSHGLAVVATNVGGVAEVIDDGRTGVLVRPGDARAFAEALERLMSCPESILEIGRAAATSATRFLDHEMIKQLEQAIAELVSLPTARR